VRFQILKKSKKNLIIQFTAAVRWSQAVQQMIKNGATSFTEFGCVKVLVGMVGKIYRSRSDCGLNYRWKIL